MSEGEIDGTTKTDFNSSVSENDRKFYEAAAHCVNWSGGDRSAMLTDNVGRRFLVTVEEVLN